MESFPTVLKVPEFAALSQLHPKTVYALAKAGKRCNFTGGSQRIAQGVAMSVPPSEANKDE